MNLLFFVEFALTIGGTVCGILLILNDEKDRGNSLLPLNVRLWNEHREKTREHRIVRYLRSWMRSWTDRRLCTLASGLILSGRVLMSLRELLS